MTDKEAVEAVARAIAERWGEHWECCCDAERGMDCDCGDAMSDERDSYEDRLCRNDCRVAARAALAAARPFHFEEAARDAIERAEIYEQSTTANTPGYKDAEIALRAFAAYLRAEKEN
ncbi:hypothetical protein ACLB6G_20540 [Zhengella sp. ZM62]|uniref:hypothetical protein n=1 Tax=Zhengella sedimenti TaxID=3390035 RepID=UPI003976EE60